MAPQSSVPPSLPPSVEEAYRRKCVQLKNRTNEVEEANDAARLRLSRIKRQVEKLRIERAFLLEQLTKRTSTNVEDSDGSPSPPPTEQPPIGRASSHLFQNEADANPRKPKEKPLRVKRGHRKVSATEDPEGKEGEPATSAADRPQSATPADEEAAISEGAFKLFAKARRPELEEKSQDDQEVNVDDELERSWKDLPEAEKETYIAEYKASRPAKKGGDEAAAEDADDADKATPAPAEPKDKEAGKDDEGAKDDEGDRDDDIKEEKKEAEDQEAEDQEKKPEPKDEDVEMSGNDVQDSATSTAAADKDGRSD